MFAHRREPIAVELVRRFLRALEDVDDPRAALYADVVLSIIDDAVRRALEAEMNLETYEFRSETFRRFIAERLANAAAEALAEGKAEGRAEGALAGLRHALLTVLDARGVPLDDEQRARIEACTEREHLDEWLVRAVHVADADELFAT